MKRKGSRSIPDFSTKRNAVQKPGAAGVAGHQPLAAVEKSAPPPVPRPPAIKPQGTSSKSGRRGQ